LSKHGIVAGLLALAVVGAALAGCESSKPAPFAPPHGELAPAPSGPAPLDVFSAERAWSDLVALGEASASDGGDPRAVLRAALEPLGLELRELDTGGSEADGRPVLHHLAATLKGSSPDLFVLIAPYDGGGNPAPPPLGGNVGTSGAALLLELARVFSTRTNAYTLRFVFLAGEQSASSGADRWRGSLDLAERMDEQRELERTRLLVAFDGVCAPDLRIVRDLASHRVFREEFFKAAQRVARERTFPVEQGFEQTQASHVAFLDRGLRASVAIVGARAASELALEDPPSGCVPESIESVGLVALEAIDTIAARLAKIDRFARSPLSELTPMDLSPAARAPTESATRVWSESVVLPATAPGPFDDAGGRSE
jgi:hypothetical protein